MSRFYDLSVQDVARKLNLSVDHVRRLTASGELPGVRVGKAGQWRYCEADIETALHGRAVLNCAAGGATA